MDKKIIIGSIIVLVIVGIIGYHTLYKTGGFLSKKSSNPNIDSFNEVTKNGIKYKQYSVKRPYGVYQLPENYKTFYKDYNSKMSIADPNYNPKIGFPVWVRELKVGETVTVKGFENIDFGLGAFNGEWALLDDGNFIQSSALLDLDAVATSTYGNINPSMVDNTNPLLLPYLQAAAAYQSAFGNPSSTIGSNWTNPFVNTIGSNTNSADIWANQTNYIDPQGFLNTYHQYENMVNQSWSNTSGLCLNKQTGQWQPCPHELS